MDGAILATNAAQLKMLLSNQTMLNDTLWFISLILVSASITFQVLLAIFLSLLARNNLEDGKQKKTNERLNNLVLILTGIVFAINILTNILVQVDLENYERKNKTQ